jgi:hypothetical protein
MGQYTGTAPRTFKADSFIVRKRDTVSWFEAAIYICGIAIAYI